MNIKKQPYGLILGFFIALVLAMYIGYKLNHTHPINSGNLNIAVLDLNEMKNTEVSKHFQAKIEKEHKNAHETMIGYEKKLRALDTEIKELKSKTHQNVDLIRQKDEQFKKEQLAAEQSLSKKRDDLNQYFGKMQDQINNILDSIVNKIVKEKRLHLVLNADLAGNRAVVYSDPQFNITREVLTELDVQTKKMLPELFK